MFEWANSPIVYKTSLIWDQIYDTAKAYFSKKTAVYHYYGTAAKTFFQDLQEEQVKYKKYFYTLRPLMAAKYIEEHGNPSPVQFGDLLMKQKFSKELKKEIEKILEVKQISNEGERYPQNPMVQQYLAEEIGRQKLIADQMPDDRNRDWEVLNQLFLAVLRDSISV